MYRNEKNQVIKRVNFKEEQYSNYFEVKENKILYIIQPNETIRLFDTTDKEAKSKTILKDSGGSGLSYDIIQVSE